MNKSVLRIISAFAAYGVAAGAPLHAQQAAAPSANVTAEDYRVHPGDQIEVYVWGEERLQRAVRILPDGSIAFPLVGQLEVAGRTLGEIETLVTEALRPEYRGEVPRVTISMVETAGLQFSIMGRINSPGTFTPTRQINLLEALAMAGGPSEFADLNDILILRKQGNTLVPLKVSVARLFRARVSERDVERANILDIQPGDTIIVP